jgi:hypothetical protein
LASAPVALDEQTVPAGQVNPSAHGNASQWPAALQRWVALHDVAVHAGSQAVESILQHGGVLDTQIWPVGQLVSSVQPCCGGGVTQYDPQAEDTLDGFDVHV